MLKILITGAAGFIGSNLSLDMVSKGIIVTAVDNLSDYYSVKIKNKNINDIIDQGCNFIKFDLYDDNYNNLECDFDFIIHLAAQPGISSSVCFEQYERNNLNATVKLLDFARLNKNLKLFIYGSTSSVYGKIATLTEDTNPLPASNYGLTKLAGEHAVMMYGREYGLPVTSLRLYSVYGERERPDKLFPKLFDSYFSNKQISIFRNSFEHQRSFSYVDDIIYAINLVIQKYEFCKNEIYNIGNEESTSVKESLEIFNAIVGKKININILSDRPGDQLSTKANIDKAKKVLGFDNKYSLEDGLRKTFEWHKRERGI